MRTINKSERPLSSESLFVVKFNGNKTRTLDKFYKKIAKRLHFPDYFGKNMDALADCLSDLSWIENNEVKLFIKNIDSFLSKEDAETKESILDIFVEATKSQIEEDCTFEVISVTSDQ
ncbi:MAG: RNAse (barnase) inhibitor barstar [Maribacter sp.]|jgi:RNAse (barnase) inhibitor barstar